MTLCAFRGAGRGAGGQWKRSYDAKRGDDINKQASNSTGRMGLECEINILKSWDLNPRFWQTGTERELPHGNLLTANQLL